MPRFRPALGATLAALTLNLHAAPLTYDYSGTFTSGPLLGQSFTGRFGFDDSLAVPNATRLGADLITDLAITFEGITYDETDSPLAALGFNAAGDLVSFLFGNQCVLTAVLTCSAGPSLPGSWYASRSVTGYAGLGAQPGDPAISFALNPTWGLVNGVPEPGTGALLLAAMATLPLVRRRRRWMAGQAL